MYYSRLVRLIGSLMGIILLYQTILVGTFMLLSGLNGTRSYSTIFLIFLVFVALLCIGSLVFTFKKRNKKAPIFFATITILTLTLAIISFGAIGRLPQVSLFVGTVLSAFLTIRTYLENKK
ncbi:hypothetical protein ACLM5H_10350 [Fredinandcohnia humi]